MVDEPTGYVYLIHAVGTSFYKIGHARDVGTRLEALRKKFAPQELQVIHTFPCRGWAGGPEYRLHQWFIHKHVCWAERRLRSEQEWFILDDEDVAFIKSIDAETCRSKTPGVGLMDVRASDPFHGRGVEWLSLRHGEGRYNIGDLGASIIGKEEKYTEV
jgi:Meiotically up-regulated gene 113